MIPYLLDAVGGHLLGDSVGKEIDSKIPKFKDGGQTDGKTYKFSYKYDGTEFFAFVKDNNGKTIWRADYPVIYEDKETGEEIEELTIFDSGIMQHPKDTKGLERYLKSSKIIKSNDKIIS